MSIFYDFVDILGPSPFDTKKTERRYTGKLVLEMETLSPVFVGSGFEKAENEILYKSFVRFSDKPIIPGSSVKGMLRTICQAVSYSCIDVDRRIKNDLPYKSDNCNCIVCNTFGKMKLRGRVNIGDFVLEKGERDIIRIPIQMNPHIEKKDIYYRQDGKLRGIKFYRHGDYRILENTRIAVETITEGGVFAGEIIFHDLRKQQLELLCYALGFDGSFHPKVGGNKSGFLGSCVFKVRSAVLDRENFDPSMYAKNYGAGDNRIEQNKKKLCEILSFDKRILTL